jgi:26S proteasome regulatory subunit T4
MSDDDNNNAEENAAAPAPVVETQQERERSEREQVLDDYRAKIREHREVEARLKRMREDVKGLGKRYQKTEDDLTALQSVGQIIGDVLKRLDAERFIVKASSGPRYVVGCRTRLNHDNLKPGTRVALDMTTLTIMRVLPREVDPTVFHMQAGEEDGGVSFADIGGLNEQIRELREVVELPLTNPELFIRVGIKVRTTYDAAMCWTLCSKVFIMCVSHIILTSFSTYRLPKACFSTGPQEQERLCLLEPWPATSMRHS